jgi:hypothetical protein
MKPILYHGLIYFIVFCKIVFVILTVLSFHYRRIGNTRVSDALDYWRNRIDFLFMISMAVFLSYLFFPKGKNVATTVDSEERFLLFLFGIFLLCTANWSQFFSQSKWIQSFQALLR